MENSKKTITIEPVSLTVAILFMSIYLFGGFPIIYLFVNFLALANYPSDLVKFNSYCVTSTFQIVMVCVLNYFMLKRYRNYLLSHHWKMYFRKYLIVGLKWSIPVIILHSILISIPSVRNGIISNYVTMRTSPLRDLSETIFILFSVRILICAIFEEFLFRGIIQQKFEKFFNPSISVFIASGIFALAHCIYYDMVMSTIVSAYFLGLLCGFAFKKTRSCLSAIVPHVVNNTGSIVLVLIIQKEIPF